MNVERSLFPWYWCLFWLVVVWICVIVITESLWLSAKKNSFSIIQPAQVSESDKCFSVLALGDSLLRQSIPESDVYDRYLGEGICWSHYSQSNGSLNNFLKEEILKHRFSVNPPDLTIIQDSLLLSSEPLVKNYFHKSKKVFSHLLKGVLLKEDEGRLNDSETKSRGLSSIKIKKHASQVGERHARSIPIRPRLLAALLSLKDKNLPLIILKLPRSKQLELSESIDSWEEYLAKNGKKWGANFKILGSTPMPADHYFDGFHANDRGMRIRSKQIAELVQEASDDH